MRQAIARFFYKPSPDDFTDEQHINANGLGHLKIMLYGDNGEEGKVCAKVQEQTLDNLTKHNLLPLYLARMPCLEFETRKIITHIFTYFFKHHGQKMVSYCLGSQANAKQTSESEALLQVKASTSLNVLKNLIYSSSDTNDILTILLKGEILRNALAHEPLLTSVFTNLKWIDHIFDSVQHPEFRVSSDAFSTLQCLLTIHPSLSAKFVENNFNWFVAKFDILLLSKNYMIQRQTLALLTKILMLKKFQKVMFLYSTLVDTFSYLLSLFEISTSECLKYDIFNVLKIFIANPNKTQDIKKLIASKRTTLIDSISDFKITKKHQEEFVGDKAILLHVLSQT